MKNQIILNWDKQEMHLLYYKECALSILKAYHNVKQSY